MKLRVIFCAFALSTTILQTQANAQVEDFASVVSSGVYSVYPNYYSSSSVSSSSGTSSVTQYSLYPNFSRTFSPSSGTLTQTDYTGNFYAKDAVQAWDAVDFGSSAFDLTPSGWKQSTWVYDMGVLNSSTTLLTEQSTGQKLSVSLNSTDVSGQTLWQLAGSTTDINSKNEFTRLMTVLTSYPEALERAKNTPLPAGSKQYVLQANILTDRYMLQSNPLTCSASDCTVKNFKSFTELIDAYKTTANFSKGIYINSNLRATFDAGGTDAGGTMSLWSGYVKQTETAKYEYRTVYGQKLIFITALPSQLKDNYSSLPGIQIFGIKDNLVHDGYYIAPPEQNSNSQAYNWNKTAIEAIFKILGWPSVEALSGKTVTGGAVVAEVTKPDSPSVSIGIAPTSIYPPETIYKDNLDGTVTDMHTGLVWMRCSLGQTWSGTTCTGEASLHTLTDASTIAKNTKFAGQTDWRVPNIRELKSLHDIRHNLKPINGQYFPNTSSQADYWTTTPIGNAYWVMYFGNTGGVTSFPASSQMHTRLVRAGKAKALISEDRPSTDFVDNQDGTVTHKATGLQWKRCSEGQTWTGQTCTGTQSKLTWQQAKATTGNFAGKVDWRIPTATELKTLLDYTKDSTSLINESIFPVAETKEFWTSSLSFIGVQAHAVKFSWMAGFGRSLTEPLAVRLVRKTTPVIDDALLHAVTIRNGWNLLGNTQTAAIDVNKQFTDAAIFNTVWKWNSTLNGVGGWEFYAPSLDAEQLKTYASSKGYGVLSTINPGDGYWVNAKAASALPASDAPVFKVVPSTLAKGWNMIATGNIIAPTHLNSDNSGNITTLWAWDNPLNQWYFYAPSLESSGGLNAYISSKNYLDFTQAAKTLGHGVGFWVNK